MADQGIRTVVWGTGNMGRAAIRTIDAHPQLALDAVLVANPDKVGRDAGELAGVDRLKASQGGFDSGHGHLRIALRSRIFRTVDPPEFGGR